MMDMELFYIYAGAIFICIISTGAGILMDYKTNSTSSFIKKYIFGPLVMIISPVIVILICMGIIMLRTDGMLNHMFSIKVPVTQLQTVIWVALGVIAIIWFYACQLVADRRDLRKEIKNLKEEMTSKVCK